MMMKNAKAEIAVEALGSTTAALCRCEERGEWSEKEAVVGCCRMGVCLVNRSEVGRTHFGSMRFV